MSQILAEISPHSDVKNSISSIARQSDLSTLSRVDLQHAAGGVEVPHPAGVVREHVAEAEHPEGPRLF